MTDDPMTIATLLSAIGPWAEVGEPGGYIKTVALIRIARTAEHERQVRRYLARLIDLRCERDPAWRATAPLDLLMESGQSIRMRHRPTGRILTVTGRHAPPPHRVTFAMLAWSPALFAQWLVADPIFDLEALV